MLPTGIADDRKRNNGRTASIDTVGKLGDESNVTYRRARNLKVLIRSWRNGAFAKQTEFFRCRVGPLKWWFINITAVWLSIRRKDQVNVFSEQIPFVKYLRYFCSFK